MEEKKKSSSNGEVESKQTLSKRTEENLEAVFGEIDNKDIQLSDEHVTLWLENQSKLHQHMRDDHPIIVSWEMSSAGWYTDNGRDDEYSHCGTLSIGVAKYVEVVGNIYENPELLK